MVEGRNIVLICLRIIGPLPQVHLHEGPQVRVGFVSRVIAFGHLRNRLSSRHCFLAIVFPFCHSSAFSLDLDSKQLVPGCAYNNSSSLASLIPNPAFSGQVSHANPVVDHLDAFYDPRTDLWIIH